MADFQQGRQAVVDRLKRRLNVYRNHSTVGNHHFESTSESIYGDQHKQTLHLKQRHIESKVKKNTKKSDKKQDSSSLLSTMGQSKLLARSHDQASGSGEGQENEPAAKKQRIANGSMVTSVASDISDFQIVQQLHNIKSRSSPNNASTSNPSIPSTNSIPNASLNCTDPLDGLSDTVLGAIDADDAIKKENDLDIPNDSLLEDFGELSNFEDMDMGINLEDFVHDLDLDNIKNENSNPALDNFFKNEPTDNLFDDPSNISTDSGVVNGSSNGQLGNQSKVSSSTASPVYPPYSNTPPASHCSTATSFPSNSFSSSMPSHSFSSNSTSSLSTPFSMTNELPKMRVNAANNMNLGQSDMVLAAQTLKQMAEQHQTKLSPTGNVVRPSINEFNSYNLGGNTIMTQSSPMMTQSPSIMTQSSSLPNQLHTNSINQMSPLYNQNIGNEMEMKRRQQMMQQFSLQQQMQQQQANIGHCSQQSNPPHAQSIQQSQPQQQQQQQQKVQHQSQISSQQSQHLQTQNQQQLHQQAHQSPQQHSQVTHMQQQNSQHNQQTASHAQQTQQQQPQLQQVSQPQQQANQLSQQQAQLQQQTQQQQQSQLQQQQQAQNQVQQANQQSQIRNSLSPFSNRMSPMSSYSHPQQSQGQIGMSPQYANSMCTGMTNNSIRGTYPTPTRGSSPIPQVPQGQPSNIVPTANQPRYMQQQMMGSVGMMRPQMMTQSGQMMARPPPPEYRQAAMMQQHQAMMGQPMSQNMPQLHQGMGQMGYQGIRPGYRPGMGGSPLGNMGGGQMMGGMNQQSIPANIPNMKASLVQGNGMAIPVTMSGSMGQGGVGPNGPMTGNGMSVSMTQVTGGASMGMVNARPTMIQRTRPPNVNMGMPGLAMGTQMPPSRPEWRQMMMQQNQTGMMMGPAMRHQYQQVQQSGAMIGQGGQMMPMQRSQAHMMGMMSMQNNPGMQHASGMGTGHPMQGNGAMPTTHSNPGMQSMAMGGRMQQHSMPSMGQGQVHMGMQMSQQGMQDSRNTTSMTQPQHGGSPSSMVQMGASPTAAMGHLGNPGGHSSMNPMGGSVNPGMNHMSSTNMNPLSQGSGNSTTVNAHAQGTQNPGNMSGINTHPRSPATMGQMHPCSPAAAGAGGGPQRPLSNPSMGMASQVQSSNPSMGMSASQGQNSNSSQSLSGSCSPLLVCSSSSGMMATQTQGRQTVGGNLASIRTTNHGPQALGILRQQGQQGQNLNQSGNNISNSQQTVMVGGKNNNNNNGSSGGVPASNVSGGGNCIQRPDSRGGGGGGGVGGPTTKTEPPSMSNPPSNSASNDFDLMFNEGEFASLLN